jgi:hypothetical protein
MLGKVIVIPAQGGIQRYQLDPGLRRGDEGVEVLSGA